MKRGPKFEADVVRFLREDGWDKAERRVMGGRNDAGDIAGIPNVCLEVKNTSAIEIGRAVAELEKEQKNAQADFGAVVFKRRSKPTEAAYVVTSLAQYSRMLRILAAEGWL